MGNRIASTIGYSTVTQTYAVERVKNIQPDSVTTPNREQDLARQLDERLTTQLQLIRQQMTEPRDGASTEGVGNVLDIRA